jgi:RNA 2',3'-cyclic 3'-phosphodiesterase
VLERLDALAADAVARGGGRRTRRDSLHLTLAFIGAATAAQREVLEAAAGRVRAAPFDLRLDRLGWWPHNRILWAGAHETPSGQRRLFESLGRELAAAGIEPDQRPWVPHVTLARNVRGDRIPEFGDPLAWTVREFTLVASRLQPSGARYTVLRRWPLHGAAGG